MKILIVNNMVPFLWGGAEELALSLRKHLIAVGHQSEILRIPFQWEPATSIPSQMLMVRALEVWNVDHVVALKFPAYLIRHSRKTLWLLHQYRQAYDLFDTPHSNLRTADTGAHIREAIVGADNECFSECRRVFTNSEVTLKRAKLHNNIEAEALPPPVNDPELFMGDEPQGYIFAGGRINALKRQHLLVEAMAKTPRQCRLVVAGPPDTEDDASSLIELVHRLGLSQRVTLDLRFLARAEYARYLNGASAVSYIPYDEDSLGYVAMEAALAGKPVVSASDSGGVLGLVRHGETGLVADPDPESLAQQLSRISVDSRLARTMGEALRHALLRLRIDWPSTIDRLLS